MFYKFLAKEAKKDGIEKLVVGAVITNDKGEVLIAKRKPNDFMGGIYEIPGGNAEDEETILETLIRETKEETNLDIKKVDCYINQFDYTSDSGKKSRQFNFKVEVEKGPIVLTEHDSYKWIKPEDIVKETEISPKVKYGLLVYKFNEEMNDLRGKGVRNK